MPRIFDNIKQQLLTALSDTLNVSERADFCIGYFNLRGWKKIQNLVENFTGENSNCCRLLIGMQQLPKDSLYDALSLTKKDISLDNRTANQLKKKLAEEFKEQLTVGAPTNEDEVCLRKLSKQIKSKRVIVKVFLRYSLHAKLYLLFREDPNNPITGYLGSSNLTFAGLVKQGELNIDVLDHDACNKLSDWFNDRWNDIWCIDISEELASIIDNSWARETLIPPYYIYLKMAYHLSQEARAGLLEFRIPKDFKNKLFEFQKAAVKIAAHHLNKRDGVLIGDVVGLGKTLMATAIARIFEDDHDIETLIICPKNLVKMWNDYRETYRLRGKVMSLSTVINDLTDLRRYRLVVLDESHNLRNRFGKRYQIIREYIAENESKCILLSATPYNKTYLDLSNQLRLFVEEEKNLGIRPEQYLREIGETEFIRRHQCSLHSIAAFEQSFYTDDWRELMRLYLIRRTRSFIMDHYAETDPKNGRKYLTFEDGERSYFPDRLPKTLGFKIDEKDPEDQYARMYNDDIVEAINGLHLPRYGLGNYIDKELTEPPTKEEEKQLDNLSRAGKRLMGFCRTNLFKRLESSGYVFIQSVKRHILRNYVYLFAIQNNYELPIGSLDVAEIDSRFNDEDVDDPENIRSMFEENDEKNGSERHDFTTKYRVEEFEACAEFIYKEYSSKSIKRFNWMRPDMFIEGLALDLADDINNLMRILNNFGEWNPEKDTKLDTVFSYLKHKHAAEKVIIFSQFADTVNYLEQELKKRGIEKLSGVTGSSSDPTVLAWKFSPESNEKRKHISKNDELRILIATDVLSEGQNLQDCAIIINYDLPWAIIRLIQRAGRVDRIGQKAENIICYSFLPADGVERIIRLRARVRQRLSENAEVVGTDEAFFEDDRNDQTVIDLYNEMAGILDDEDDKDVDLASYAYQIWDDAIKDDPKLKKIIPELPPVVFSAKDHQITPDKPEGVLIYMRTAEDNDALAWINNEGESVTESQYMILRAAECNKKEPAKNRSENHHALVKKGVAHIIEEEKSVGGQLGRPSGARFKTYVRLKNYAENVKDTLFNTPELRRSIEEIYKFPLRQTAVDTINRQLRSGIEDQKLAELVINLRNEDRLCLTKEEKEKREPSIICSLGLKKD